MRQHSFFASNFAVKPQVLNLTYSMAASTDKPTGSKRSFGKLILLLWATFITPIALGALLLFFISQGWLWELPSFEELENPKSNLATEIYSSDGEVIGKYFRENRTPVDYEEISPHVISALVATEDERFFQHSGIDLRSLTRAVAKLGRNGGGSTITQQLAKMLYHEPSSSILGRIKQKLMEWVIAIRLERQYTKEEILSMYLNRFDFVNQAVGIKSAAQVYFGKHPGKLEVHEAAMLVGMAKNPSLFNPVRRADTTLKRRNVVFYQMKRNGLLNDSTFDTLSSMPLDLRFQRVDHKEGIAPYFREALRQDLGRIFSEEDPETGELMIQKSDGTRYSIYRDGLKIYTTIDARLQRYAEWAVTKHLGGELQKDFWYDLSKKKNAPFDHKWSDEKVENAMNRARKQSDRYQVYSGKQCGNCGRRGKFIEKITENDQELYYCNASDCHYSIPVLSEDSILKTFDKARKMQVFTWMGEKDTVLTPNDSIRYYKSFLRAGLMSVEPATGHIKAWVGGINSKYFAYDHVRTAKRQVGSTFKPFIYSLAMSGNYSPCFEIPNLDYTIHKGEYGLLKDWTPRNAGFNFDGMVSLQYGLGNSMNNITAWVLKQYSPQAVIDLARRAGIKSDLEPVPSIILGVADVSLYEMVGAYTTFANQGEYIKPTYISRIEDKNGKVIWRDYSSVESETIVVEPITAFKMLTLMKGTVDGVRNDNDGYNQRMGTAIRLRFNSREYGGIKHPIAGKTGTTQNHTDGWFMGLTPDLVTGVWVGGEDRSIRFRHLSKGMGTNMALPIWGYFMKKAWADESIGLSTEDFEAPEGMDPNLFNCEKNNRNTGSGGYDYDDSYNDSEDPYQ